ncbi:MAG: pyridoxamine 5'-phosphate oxidase family protein, partial [Aquincola sp.]|nr:pyridoxamine 5'-phosphate oxidase family protein [Aquincola sp.]
MPSSRASVRLAGSRTPLPSVPWRMAWRRHSCSCRWRGQGACIPTACWRIGDHLYIHGSNGGRLIKLLVKGTQACVTITHVDGLVLARAAFNHGMNYRSAVVYGSFEAVAEKAAALEAFMRHIAPGREHDARPGDPWRAGARRAEHPARTGVCAGVGRGGRLRRWLGSWAGLSVLFLFGRRAVGGGRRGSCWGGRPCGPTPLRCSRRGRAAELATFADAHCARTTTASQFTKRAARADLAAALLAAPEIAPPPPTHRTARAGWCQPFAGSARKRRRASSTAACTAWLRCAQREPETRSATVDFCAGPCGWARGR